jgi:hypothetical protein
MVHLDGGTFSLSLPYCVHQNIDSALGGHLGFAIQYWHSQNHGRALLARFGKFLEEDLLTIELGLTVEVGWGRGGIGLIWCVSRLARKDVICRNVDDKDVSGCGQGCQ